MDNLVDFQEFFVGRFIRIIKYWFKIIESQDHKFIEPFIVIPVCK